MTGEQFEEELYREHLYFVYEDKCKELEKEIERLKQINEEHQKLNGELRVENERLNNIINELEKYLIEQVEKSYSNDYDDVLDKLQELKGSDKE